MPNTNKSSSNNNNKKETSTDTSKENSKVSDVQKPDYIHVRARRGQATDSHSLAERVSMNLYVFHSFGIFEVCDQSVF